MRPHGPRLIGLLCSLSLLVTACEQHSSSSLLKNLPKPRRSHCLAEFFGVCLSRIYGF